jgi:hypothetical protein
VAKEGVAEAGDGIKAAERAFAVARAELALVDAEFAAAVAAELVKTRPDVDVEAFARKVEAAKGALAEAKIP